MALQGPGLGDGSEDGGFLRFLPHCPFWFLLMPLLGPWTPNVKNASLGRAVQLEAAPAWGWLRGDLERSDWLTKLDGSWRGYG